LIHKQNASEKQHKNKNSKASDANMSAVVYLPRKNNPFVFLANKTTK
jgi:hypothetical protein